MPNPDDEQTIANPPGPESAAPGEASSSSSAPSDSPAPESGDLPGDAEPAPASDVDASIEPADTSDSPGVDADVPREASVDEGIELHVQDGAAPFEESDEGGESASSDSGDLANPAESPAEEHSDDEVPTGEPDIETTGAGDDEDEVAEANDAGDDADDDAPGPDAETEPGWEVAPPAENEERTYDWPTPPDAQHRERPLAWVDWRFSLLFPAAIGGVILTLLWSLLASPDTIEFRVIDAGTGDAIAGAHVVVGNEVYETGADGVVVIERPELSTTVDVTADGYYGVQGELDDSTGSTQVVELRSQEPGTGFAAPGHIVESTGDLT
jgi:hypothetical protein